MSPVDRVAEHFHGLAALAGTVAERLSPQIVDVVERVQHALTEQHKLMFCGNGASAADAQHLATQYVVRLRRNRQPMAAIALTTDTSLLTAAANDLGFAYIFARQVQALGRRGDILFLHSTLEKSQNLLYAAAAARECGVQTVALLAAGGGPLADIVDVPVIVPTDNAVHAQEIHLAIGHIICDLVEEQLIASSKAP
ncbi:MAG: D-sedoheptulose-7-phosphate isomerase [Longimicrobiales bacterium]